MFYKRLCDQWENEADEAIAELERQQGRTFTDAQRAVFRARGEHRFSIPDGSRWGDVKAASTNIGEVLTKAMRAVADSNEELRGVFTVDWNQPAPDGSGRPLIANEVVHALIQHFDEHDLSNKNVPPTSSAVHTSTSSSSSLTMQARRRASSSRRQKSSTPSYGCSNHARRHRLRPDLRQRRHARSLGRLPPRATVTTRRAPSTSARR